MRDRELHLKFKSIGNARKQLSNQLCFLIPLVFKKKIYKKYGFSSIFEYGQKLAGLSKIQIDLSLNIYKKTHDFKLFRKAVYKVGIYKVALLLGVLNISNEAFLYDKLIKLSKRALETFVKEYREKIKNLDMGLGQMQLHVQGQANILDLIISSNHEKILNILQSFPFSNLIKVNYSKSSNNITDQNYQFLSSAFAKNTQRSISLTTQQEEKFNILKKRLKTISNIDTLDQILDLALLAITENFPGKVKTPVKKPLSVNKMPISSSRYLPLKLKRNLIQSTKGICSYPNCHSAIDEIHHADHFSISKRHNSIIGLCKIHHEIVHSLSDKLPDTLFFKYKNFVDSS